MDKAKDDPIVWYLQFHKEPKPGVIFYTQQVPLDALNRVKEEFETLQARVRELENKVKQYENPSDGKCMDVANMREKIQSLEARLADAENLNMELYEALGLIAKQKDGHFIITAKGAQQVLSKLQGDQP